ncbi:alpha-2-macroglobulin-like protein 1 isoform X1 [Melanerpes formicivorus]|uniref:alpha-2-macroglobulin-like protein 1 isoform X1 n=1 Tax=Melanerpes formicivorus TaxID=211600 RepID=UPI00358DF478
MGSAATLPCLLLFISSLTAGASAKQHYLVIFPSTFHYTHTGQVHIHLVELEAPVRVTLHLESSHEVPDVVLEEQGSGVLQLAWPRFTHVSAEQEDFYEVAELQLSIQGASLQVSEKRLVLLEALELRVLFQTDKDSYEPGAAVKLRIVCLDHNLMPRDRELQLVTLQGPDFEQVMEWRGVRLRQGMAELSFLLPPDSVPGTYTIWTGRNSHSFSVKEQGLPQFAALLQLPHAVMPEDETIPLRVCGWNPSGKAFRGSADARLCQYILPPGRTHPALRRLEGPGTKGCFSSEVPAAAFNLSNPYAMPRLYAFAWLQQEGTGLWQTVTQTCLVMQETTTISLQSPDFFYNPGAPYKATVLLKGPKGSVLREKELLLVINNMTGLVGIQTLLTDELGRASVELDTSGWSDKITLHGAFKDGPPAAEPEILGSSHYQSVVYRLYPSSWGGKAFLAIHRVAKELPCGQTLQLKVDYFLGEKATGMEQHSLDVVFLVLAKGAIVTVLRKELHAEPGLKGFFSLELPISLQLAPRFRVLGYMVLPDGELVADSTKFSVAKCFPTKVNLSFSEQRALGGSQLRLKVQAAPGSLCATYARDQRAQPSASKPRLSPDVVYDSIPRFYEGNYPLAVEEFDLPTCALLGFREVITALPSLNCFEVPGNHSWKRCFRSLQRRAADTPGPSTLLKEASLKVITNTLLGCSSRVQYQKFQSLLFATGAPLEAIEQAGVLQDTGLQRDLLRTWLWELLPVGESGSAEVMVTVPNATTSWEAGMLCTTPLGLGLAPATTLTTFKPLSVELALPSSVAPHEAFTPVATVANYLQQCLRVQVRLVTPVGLEILAGMSRVYRDCVCPEEPRTFHWRLRATSQGNMTAMAVARTLNSGNLCGTQVPTVLSQGQQDTDSKVLLVQPPASK